MATFTDLERLEKIQSMPEEQRQKLKLELDKDPDLRAEYDAILESGFRQQESFRGAYGYSQDQKVGGADDPNAKGELAPTTETGSWLNTFVRGADYLAGSARAEVARGLEAITGRDVLNEGRLAKARTGDDSFQDFDEILKRAFPDNKYVNAQLGDVVKNKLGLDWLDPKDSVLGRISPGDILDLVVDPINFIPVAKIAKGIGKINKRLVGDEKLFSGLAQKSIREGKTGKIWSKTERATDFVKRRIDNLARPGTVYRKIGEKIFESGIPKEMLDAGKYKHVKDVVETLVKYDVVGHPTTMVKNGGRAAAGLFERKMDIIRAADDQIATKGISADLNTLLKPVSDSIDEKVSKGLLSRTQAREIKERVLGGPTGAKTKDEVLEDLAPELEGIDTAVYDGILSKGQAASMKRDKIKAAMELNDLDNPRMWQQVGKQKNVSGLNELRADLATILGTEKKAFKQGTAARGGITKHEIDAYAQAEKIVRDARDRLITEAEGIEKAASKSIGGTSASKAQVSLDELKKADADLSVLYTLEPRIFDEALKHGSKSKFSSQDFALAAIFPTYTLAKKGLDIGKSKQALTTLGDIWLTPSYSLGGFGEQLIGSGARRSTSNLFDKSRDIREKNARK